MEKILCPKHKCEMLERKGISSKNNKPYHFWGCPTKEDGKWCQETWRPPTRQDIQHKEVMDMLKKIWNKLEGVEEKPEGWDEIPVVEDDEFELPEE